MAFKNAFKNLIAHFGVVWAVLLYITAVGAVLIGLSMPFLLPVFDALDGAGVFTGIADSFSTLLGDGGWNGFWQGMYGVYSAITHVFDSNSRVVSLTVWFIVVILMVSFRFFFGLYEVPLATVLDGRMSCNAHYGLGGKFFSTLTVSVRYSLAKMPIMVAFDALTVGAVYGLGKWLGMGFILPFAAMTVIVLLRSFRSGLLACWAPAVADGCGVLRGFARSAEIFFKRFGSIYSTFLVTWMLIVAISLFLGIFTLGVGLLIAVPFSMSCFGYLGITEYYNKTGKRYYIDGVVFTPPTDNAL